MLPVTTISIRNTHYYSYYTTTTSSIVVVEAVVIVVVVVVIVRGMHYISNASSILLFNILYVFAFIKIMYYECWNKRIGKKVIVVEIIIIIIIIIVMI